MKYCKKCLQPDTRPNILFDEHGVCYACLYEESKVSIDCDARFNKLLNIAKNAKAEAKKRGNIYECVIGVSGGKDSTFQAVYAKEKLGLRPLLINCVPDEITQIGQHNIDNLNKLGFDIKELIDGIDGVSEDDMYFYSMPDVGEMKQKGIRAIFLQYYAKEWSQVLNADFSIARGIKGRMDDDLHDIGRFRRFTALDSDLQIANQMIKYLKFGFGFATDEACYDIREGRLSREDALWYVNEYDGLCGEKYIKLACDYLGISKDEFFRVVDGFVNKDLFYKDENGKWKPKFKVGQDFNIN